MIERGPILLFLAGLFGVCVGSFLNVVIWRVPAGLSINSPGSHCPRCQTPLRWHDNIPIASWLALRARCRSCTAPISARYPLVEAACAALWIAAAARFGFSLATLAYAIAFAGLLALSLIDLDTFRLPDAVLAPTFAASAALLAATAALDSAWGQLARAGAGALIGFAALLLIHLAVPHGMGFGDVKLAGLLGLLLGWTGLAAVPFGLFAGFLLGAVVGVTLMARGKAGRKTKIPFGPFLAAGAVATILWGGPLVDWYLDLIGG